VAGGNHSCGLTTSGDVVCWGSGAAGSVNVPATLPVPLGF
jgi:alpha-tubulin suppressor-like RCC1 family protein